MIKRVCADCQRITEDGPRCKDCQAARDHHRYLSRPHLRGTYKAQAKKIRETAETCWICGEGHKPDDPFTADHLIPSDSNSILLPAHRSCNSRRGNRQVAR